MDKILEQLGDIYGALNAPPEATPASVADQLEAARSSIFPPQQLLNEKKLQFCLLGLLQKQSYDGLAMITMLEERNLKAAGGQGTVYGVLNQLENKGLVQPRWRETKDRMVKEYTITDKGEKFLESNVHTPLHEFGLLNHQNTNLRRR